ncbi:MAG: MFS transporter [Nitrospinota bacterium]|nr:MAG: MFS transporter [Nitrospinota bacterium]
MARSGGNAVRYHDLPPAYHRWKWRVLLAFAGFYASVYLGRFNFGLVIPLLIEDLRISRTEAGFITMAMMWGFGLGDLVHGRLSERFGFRHWIALGAWLTTLFNWLTSFGVSVLTLILPWTLNGFVNAMCWSPGIAMISQWWPRQDRGKAMGLVSTAAGTAILLVWGISGSVASVWGWRAAFRYPLFLTAAMGTLCWLLVRDRPSDLGLPDYLEEDTVSSRAEALPPDELKGLRPYRRLFTNWRFLIACHITGLGNIVRYGLLTWLPLYYAEAGGLNIKTMVAVTVAYPLGIACGPLLGGLISDKVFRSRRSPMIVISCLLTASVLTAIAFSSPHNLVLGVILLILGGFTLALAPLGALAVDLAGRHMSGTAAGVLDAHGYLYAGLQAIIIGWFLDISGRNWPAVFGMLAATRLLSALLIMRVRA